MAPPVNGGSASPGTCAIVYFESSSSSTGNGSISSPWPAPVLSTFLGPAPTKLYRPTLSVAALSNRKDNFDLDAAEILRYAAEGVIRSDDIWAYTGTRLGGLVVSIALDRSSWMISREG